MSMLVDIGVPFKSIQNGYALFDVTLSPLRDGFVLHYAFINSDKWLAKKLQ
jgi:hypothetical protein